MVVVAWNELLGKLGLLVLLWILIVVEYLLVLGLMMMVMILGLIVNWEIVDSIIWQILRLSFIHELMAMMSVDVTRGLNKRNIRFRYNVEL